MATKTESNRPIVIGTRGSALAMAQARNVMEQARAVLPTRRFELRVIKTTGDKLQTASMSQPDVSLPRGLFTKELEVALDAREIDIAVHSLKDLPTELPDGLVLGAVGRRADVRDVLLYRNPNWVEYRPDVTQEWSPGGKTRRIEPVARGLARLPEGTTIATSSVRRAAQMHAWRPDLRIVEIRGNVGTRLRKLAETSEFQATILAMAGLGRLRLDFSPQAVLRVDPRLSTEARRDVEEPPVGTFGTLLEPEEMLPAVGQGAVALEVRKGDLDIAVACQALNHVNTWFSVMAERAFLRELGGGCQSAVAAWGRVRGHQLLLRAGMFHDSQARVLDLQRVPREAALLGAEAASRLKA